MTGLQANRSPNGWSAMSEDLLPGVSVVDLKVVDFDASIGDRLHGYLQAWLVVEMDTGETRFSLAGRNDKTQRQST